VINSGRVPPHNLEAEQAVLASCLIDSDCLGDVKAHVGAQDFFDDRHKLIFHAIETVGETVGEGVDQITVTQELSRAGNLKKAGGAAYLSQLVANLPTSVHAEYYAGIVKQLSLCRRLITAAAQISAMAYEAPQDGTDLLARARYLLAELEPEGGDGLIDPTRHAELMMDLVSRRQNRRLDYVPFGYRDLDELSGGMYGGDFVIVGARPSVGKSQVLLETALSNATAGRVVLFASAEMSLAQLMDREIVMQTGIDMRRLRKGRLSESEWESVQAVVAEVSGLPLHFLAGRLTVAGIAHSARLLKQTRGLGLVVVDYIQLLRDRSNRKAGDTLRERIGHISNGLKGIATDLDVPVLAASQFSRQVEMRDGHRPMLADLKESGDLEQDADIVLLLHRPELYDPGKNKGILEIKMAKHRQLGGEGVVRLVWVEKEHRYRDAARQGAEREG